MNSVIQTSNTSRGGIATLSFFGRVLLSLIFLVSGVTKIMNWDQTAAFMATQKLPLLPVLLGGAVVLEIIGGLSLLFGIKARTGAFLLFAYLIAVSAIFHGFWNLEGAEAQLQAIQFMKNLAIMGGLLQVLAHGPGRISLDASSYHQGAIPREIRPASPVSKDTKAAG